MAAPLGTCVERVQAQVRPLPQVVAIFLGLMEGNRLLLDRNGDYVQVWHGARVSCVVEKRALGFTCSRRIICCRDK